MFDTVEHTGATAIAEPAGPGYVGKTTSPNLEADVFTVAVADDTETVVWDAGFTGCDAGSPTTCAVGGHTWVMNAAAGIRNPGLGGLVTGYTHEGHAVATRTGPDETVVSYSYDLVGSMVGSSDGVTMGWDARNRMVTWTDGTVSWWYGYDSGGERRVASDGVSTRRYLDVLEVEVGGDSQITYTHAGVTVAVRDTGTGDLDVVVSDHLGSPQVAWNPTTAVVTGTRSHTPYGGLRTTSGTMPGTVGYTGQHADPTGLAYYGARYYHPDLMVFISADTIIPDAGSAGGLNRYGYVAGNPVNFTDPSGHCGLVAGPDGEPIEDNTNCVHEAQTNNPHLSYYYMYGNRDAPDFFGTFAGLFRFLVFDNRQCSGDGSAVGCSIEVASALPWGKLGKLLRFLRHGDEAADALHLADDVADTLRATNEIRVATGLTTKSSARQALGQLDLTSEQLAAANRAIGRATTGSSIDVVQRGSDVVIRISRPGADGFQVFEHVVSPSGVKSVLQTAYDSAGNLVHYDPKTP